MPQVTAFLSNSKQTQFSQHPTSRFLVIGIIYIAVETQMESVPEATSNSGWVLAAPATPCWVNDPADP